MTALLSGLGVGFLLALLGLGVASSLVSGVRARTGTGFLLAAATHALLSVPAAFVPVPPLPYAGDP